MSNNEEPQEIIGFGDLEALLAGLADPSQELPSSIERLVWNNETGRRELSNTPGLVNENGVLQLVDDKPFYYDIDRDPHALYASQSAEARQQILDVLDSRGIPTGDYQKDIRAYQFLHQEANRFGKTVRVMLNDIIENVPETKQPTIRVAPTRVASQGDLRQIIKNVARQTIGEDVSDELAQRWVESFQQQQVDFQSQYRAQSGGTIEDTTSPEVSAESFIQKYQGDKVKANDFLGYFDVLGQSLRSRV